MADFDERIASMNTQMRFKRYPAALPIAYKLRLDLRLAQQTDKVQRFLEDVEKVIEALETNKVSKLSKLAKWVARSLKDSFDSGQGQGQPPEPSANNEEKSGEKVRPPPNRERNAKMGTERAIWSEVGR